MNQTTAGTVLKILLVLLVALAVVPAACTPPPTSTLTPTPTPMPTPTPLSAQEVVNRTIVATSSVKTYTMDMSMSSSMDATMTDKGQTQALKATTKGTGKGQFDVANKASKFAMQIEITAQAPSNESFSQTIETYVLDGVTYLGTRDAKGVVQWTKMKAPGTDGSPVNATTLKDIVDLVQGAPVEKLGEEQVDGKAAHIIKVTPDMGKLLAVMLKGADLPTGSLDVAKVIGNAVKSFSVKMWIDKQTSYLLKEEGQMTIALNSEAMGLPAGAFNMNVDTGMQTKFSYDAAVSITVPPEALNAPEQQALK